MKIVSFIFALVFFSTTNTFAQAEANTVTGTIKDVKPHFANSHSLMVNNVELILLTNLKDVSGNSFEINKEYKDLLVKKGETFILNPKYEGKTFKFTYNVNGKGWKCIAQAGIVKIKKIKAKK